jgi:hypothetical protein
MNKTFKISITWALVCLALNFHTQFELRGLFFGQDIKIAGATGTMPYSMHYFTLLFTIIPLFFSLTTLYLNQKIFKLIALVYATLFCFLNAFHIVSTAIESLSDLSQIGLLSFVLVANVMLVLELFKWYKETNPIESTLTN